MLLTVIILSGIIIGITSLAGILTVYQIRHTADVINSTKAIFAADAGIECALYLFRRGPVRDCGSLDDPENPPVELTNGASYYVDFNYPSIRSIGKSVQTARSFEAFFGE